MKIYLIGYMGSGKSRLGRQLSARLGYNFIDLDDLFEERFKISILDFFKKYREEDFRKVEQELLLETLNYNEIVISTGGGTPCFFDNMKLIKKNGISIYLKMDTGMLISRLKTVKKQRPLLKGKTNEELERFIRDQVAEREFYYNQADLIVQTAHLNVASVISLLLGQVK